MLTHRLSVGFADLHQFLVLISTAGWEKTALILQESVTAIGDLIVQHNGQIRKYLGDAVLFTFEDPRQAIRAAQAIAQYRRAIDSQIVRFHVGVATGDVLETEFGHPSYRLPEIFGQPVIQAIELIRAAKASPQGFALCDETRKYLTP
jgi:class 3 adenylate cyclase